MSRTRFGRWGASLSDDQFAQALAAAGVLGRLTVDDSTSTGKLTALLASPEPARWRFPWGKIARSSGRDATALAGLWSKAVANLEKHDRGERHLRGAVRLALDLEGAGSAASWVVRALSRKAVKVDGLSVRAEREAGVRWTWPLQVGFLSDPESMRLMARLQSSKYGESLASVRALQASGDGCDLLVLPYSLREAAARLLREVPPVRAGAVAVLGGMFATGLLFLVSYYAATTSYRFGLDPDNYGVPAVTATMDLLGILCLVTAIGILGIG